MSRRTSRGRRAGTRLKQVEAEITEELVFSTFSLYFINKRGWPSINEDSGNKIQWNYLNLFHPTVLKVSLLDFCRKLPGKPRYKAIVGRSRSVSTRTNLLRRFALLLAITDSLAPRRSRNTGIKTPPSDEIPSVGGHYYYYILTC